jgi:hypothetical protein
MKILRPIVRLTPKYAAFCTFETLAINGVGCGTLVFQDQLSYICPYPGLYEYWFSSHIPDTSVEPAGELGDPLPNHSACFFDLEKKIMILFRIYHSMRSKVFQKVYLL